MVEVISELQYEVEDQVLWIRFNRPDRLNALMPNTVDKVAEYMEAGDEDPAVRVMVLTGVGRAFCAGADLRGGGERPHRRGYLELEGPASSWAHFRGFHSLFMKIANTTKPTIAMVNGPAIGGGMDMALHCDLRIGCEITRFFTYQNVGQIPENGMCYSLPRIAGLGRALEMAFTGGYLDAEEAYRWGVLNKLVPSERLEEETKEMCRKIIHSPPLVQWLAKKIIRRGIDSNLETVQEMCANASGILGASEDAVEARRAFLEKRSPSFKGR